MLLILTDKSKLANTKNAKAWKKKLNDFKQKPIYKKLTRKGKRTESIQSYPHGFFQK